MPINMISDIKSLLDMPDAQIEYVGLNHLSWITKVECGGKDYLQEAIKLGLNANPMKNIKASGFSRECLKVVGAIPSCYLEYFYNRQEKFDTEQHEEKCRGEVCIELEEELLKIYQNNELHVKPKQLEMRGGAKYSLAAINLLDAIINDKKETHVVGVRNGGTLPFMADNDVVELSCIVDKYGVHPVKIDNINNQHIIEMMQTIKYYERHTVNAAVNGDDVEALRALLLHPLIGDFHAAHDCFYELKEAHRRYLPQFYRG